MYQLWRQSYFLTLKIVQSNLALEIVCSVHWKKILFWYFYNWNRQTQQKWSQKCPIPTYLRNIIHRLKESKKTIYIYTRTNTHARTNIVMLAVKAKQILLMQDDTQHTHSSPSCFSKILSVTHGMPPSLHWMRFDFKYVPSFYWTQEDHFISL